MTLEKVTYGDGAAQLTGWLARPKGTPRAAIVVFPTIMNVNPAAERRAMMLAEAGYVAMVADFYAEPVRDFEHAQDLAAALRADVDRYRQRLAAAVSALRRETGESSLALGAIGYCMGGQAVLELARSGEDLALVASFHGVLSTDQRALPGTTIRPRILVCHGDADPLAPREHVISLWEELEAVEANWHFHSYSGVRHGFTDPASDARGMAAIGYDRSADRQSWAALMSLSDEVFPAL